MPALPTSESHETHDELTPAEQYQDAIVDLIRSLPTPDAADERYYQTVLKLFIRQLEACGVTPSEQLNEAYTELLMTSKMSQGSSKEASTAACFVNYFVNESDYVRLRESPNVISAHGSTGHRTWEAALALSDYIITAGLLLLGEDGQPPHKLVELGAGTGLVGLIAAKLDPTLEVILTDGDEQVVNNLRANIALNNNNRDNNNNDNDNVESLRPRISAEVLLWNETPVVANTDLVVAADVTYDASVIPQLVACLAQFADAGACSIIVAATIRSQETFQVFQQGCTTQGLTLTKLRSYNESTRHFFIPPSSPEVIIYKISNQA
ncbi:hypothetical protein D0Z00_000141 [Geotrichum galactomycetum]|uniref:Uncharacterized protein n=1 Tax=Geotrichum galactomycetum TaxID=27317 RepID=A0ACB6VAG3_9ASCO|nr:hypothetical protein D0Z00_000141 [Geotrichum candidum]